MLQCVCMNIKYVCICACVFTWLISTFVNFSTVRHAWNAHDFDFLTGIESHVRVMAWLSTPSTWPSTCYVTRPMYVFDNILQHTQCTATHWIPICIHDKNQSKTLNTVDMTVNFISDKTHVYVRQCIASHNTHCNTLAPHMYPWQAWKQDSQLRWHECQLHTWQDPCICSTIYTHIHTVDMYVKCTYCIMTLNFIRDRTHVYILPIYKTSVNVRQRMHTRAYCLCKMHTAPYIEMYKSHVYIVKQIHMYIVEQIHDSDTFRNTWVVYLFDNVMYICHVEYMYRAATITRLLKMIGLFCKRTL